jgi:hemerythrin-like domain-containing protein
MPDEDDEARAPKSRADGRASLRIPGPGASTDSLLAVDYDHALKLQFCSLLEEIADLLPGRVDHSAANRAIKVLETGFKPHVELEEQVLFPLLRRRLPDDSLLMHVCTQLEKEHGRDTDFAHEIAEALHPLSKDSDAANPEMLGYMLRGFFEGQRRHIEWENKVILSLARGSFQQPDQAEMRAWLEATDHRRFTDLLRQVVGNPEPDR